MIFTGTSCSIPTVHWWPLSNPTVSPSTLSQFIKLYQNDNLLFLIKCQGVSGCYLLVVTYSRHKSQPYRLDSKFQSGQLINRVDINAKQEELSSSLPLKQIVRHTVHVSSSLFNCTNETSVQYFLWWVPIVPVCLFTSSHLECRRLEWYAIM